jgi:hypothetical protein
MSIKRTIPALGLLAIVAFPACRTDDRRLDEPVVEEPIQAPMVEPAPVADPTVSDPDTVMPPAADTMPVVAPTIP